MGGPLYLLPSESRQGSLSMLHDGSIQNVPQEQRLAVGYTCAQVGQDLGGSYREASDNLSVSAAQLFGGVPLLKEPSLSHLKSAQMVTGSPHPEMGCFP